MMPSHDDPNFDMQSRINDQIGALAAALPHCAPAQIVQGIDDIAPVAARLGY